MLKIYLEFTQGKVLFPGGKVCKQLGFPLHVCHGTVAYDRFQGGEKRLRGGTIKPLKNCGEMEDLLP